MPFGAKRRAQDEDADWSPGASCRAASVGFSISSRVTRTGHDMSERDDDEWIPRERPVDSDGFTPAGRDVRARTAVRSQGVSGEREDPRDAELRRLRQALAQTHFQLQVALADQQDIRAAEALNALTGDGNADFQPHVLPPPSFGGAYIPVHAPVREMPKTTVKPKITLKTSNPCWSGYHPIGVKKLGGRTVPNCVRDSGARRAVVARDSAARTRVFDSTSAHRHQTAARPRSRGGASPCCFPWDPFKWNPLADVAKQSTWI